jgi:hypothetical protein
VRENVIEARSPALAFDRAVVPVRWLSQSVRLLPGVGEQGLGAAAIYADETEKRGGSEVAVEKREASTGPPGQKELFGLVQSDILSCKIC